MKDITQNDQSELTSGSHLSIWTETVFVDGLTPLTSDIYTDVVIVGGGISGLTTAYCLLKEGKSVVVVEDGHIGSGETGRTTAHISNAVDDRYYNIEKTFAEETSALVARSHTEAISLIEEIVRNEAIDCGFERLPGYLFLHPSDDRDSLEKEYLAAIKSGIPVERKLVPGVSFEPEGLMFPGQAQFHPMLYLKGLEKAILDMGGKIFTGTHAEKIGKDGIVSSDGHKVHAGSVVVATNAPVNSTFLLPIKQIAYRSYVVGMLVEKDVLPTALWWDTGDYELDADMAPYHYVRKHRYNELYDLLIIGGEDHETGNTSDNHVSEEQRYVFLEIWAREHFPVKETVYRWSGQVMEPMDGLAYIGRNPFDHDNIYIITGDSGNGMTHGTIAGKIITDLIMGRENPYSKVYAPSRFTLSESGIAFKKMFSEIMSYFKKQPDDKSASELASVQTGEGRIVDMLDDKFGVYRSEEGQLHIVSARCTHLKCIVAWNGDEKTWDCPCHGSRFSCDGKVINGPANDDLPSYSETEVQSKQ